MRKEILERILASSEEIDLIDFHIINSEIENIATLIIEKKPQIRSIFLSFNEIGDQGAMILAKNLKELEDLSFLELYGNEMEVEGIAAIFRLRLTFPHLELAVGGNKLSNVTAIEQIRDEIFRPFSPRP